jgi:hypothetical protein
MSPDVLRRKLQKKKKRLERTACSHCGYNWCDVSLGFGGVGPGFVIKTCKRCGHRAEMYWSGGGIGRHATSAPQGAPAGSPVG